MSNKPELTAEDLALFREAVKDVKPLRHDKVQYRQRPPRPWPCQRELDEGRVMRDLLSEPRDLAELETGDELMFARTGLQYGVLQKLRQGKFSIAGELDLHGLTVPVAHQALINFLRQARLLHIRCVRIIHGKGKGSLGQRPVLKNKVNHWLQQRDEVLAFCSARAVDGGTGAVYVLLKG